MSVTSEWNMKCPKCSEDNDLNVEVTRTARLTSSGSDVDGDQEWDTSSNCWCLACGWDGNVRDAKLATAEGRLEVMWEALRAIPGLEFGDCTQFFANAQTKEEKAFGKVAKIASVEGELEFDDVPIVSRGDEPGAYVMAWV